MERVSIVLKKLLGVGLLIALPVSASEQFAPSRFGQPPMRLTAGEATTELETSDEAPIPGSYYAARVPSRGPAGLELESARPPHPAKTAKAEFAKPELPAPPVSTLASTIARKGVQEVALIAGDLGFFPKTVFVTRDVPVRLFVTGASKNTLCLMMDGFQVRKQIRSQKIEEITFTPNEPGRYRFYCPVNGMEGSLIVKEFGSNLKTASGE